MKKLFKISFAIAALLFVGNNNVFAKSMNQSDLNDLVTVGSTNISQNLFIYGKYVFVNSISSSDLQIAMNDLLDDPTYGKNYRALFSDGIAALIHKDSKNNWTNLRTGDPLAKSASIEMTHLVGSLNGDHISKKDIYSDGLYVKQDSFSNQRTDESFVDTNADLMIANVTIATNPELASELAKEYNTYNSGATAVEFNSSKNILKLTETTPLLSYSNIKTGSNDSEKWIPVLLKTNKPITKDDTVKISTSSTPLTLGKTIVSTGNTNEYVIWVNEDVKSITIQEKDSKDEQKITIEYSKPNVAFKEEVTIPEDKSNDVEILTTDKDVKVATATINGKYVNIFYTDDKNVVNLEYTVNGDKKRATRGAVGNSLVDDDDWTINDLLQLNSFVATATTTAKKDSDEVWNKKAVSFIEFEDKRTTKEDYDYVLRIRHNKEFKDNNQVAILLDLSAKGVTAPDDSNFKDNNASKSYGATSDTEYVYLVTESKEGKTVELKNGNIESIKVHFEFVDETPEIELSVDKGDSAKDIYTTDLDEPKAGANQAYKNIMKSVTLTKEETSTEGTYNVILQQIDGDHKLVAYGNSSLEDYFTTSKKWIAVIVDLGIEPTKELLTADNNLFATEKDYEKAKADAKMLGATSDTAFVIWLGFDASTKQIDYTFTSIETNASITVNFELREISTKYVVDKDTAAEGTKTDVKSVTIDPEYASQVKYDSSAKHFIVNEGLDKFVATTTIETTTGDKKETTTHTYTYVITTDDYTNGDKTEVEAHKVQNLELVKAYNIEQHTDSKKVENMNSVKSVETNGNVIEVTFNKHIDPSNDRYCLLLDLGVKNNATTTTDEIKNANRQLAKYTKYLLETTKISESIKNNLAVLCVNNKNTADEDGYSVKLHHTVNGNDSIDYEVIIKSRVEIDSTVDTLTEEDVKVSDVELDLTNGLDPTLAETFVNQDGLSTTIKDGKVYITHTKEFTPYNSTDKNKQDGAKSWFGILFDLGVNPAYLKGNGWEIQKEDYTTVSWYGGSGTQFMMWFDADNDFKEDPETGLPTLTVGFSIDSSEVSEADKAKLDIYGDEIKVTFVLVDAVDKITIDESNITERDAKAEANEWTYNKDLYKVNQEKYEARFTTDEKNNNVLTVYPVERVSDKVNTGVDGQKMTLTKGETSYTNVYYAVEIDMGRAVSIPSELDGVVIDKLDLDKGQFVLWINVEKLRNKEQSLEITDTTNGSKVSLTIKSSATVAE